MSDTNEVVLGRTKRGSNSAMKLFLDVMGSGIDGAVVRFDIGDRPVRCGDLDAPEGDDVVVAVLDERFFRDVMLYGNLGLGEAYMQGFFEVTRGSLEDLLLILLKSRIEDRIKSRFSYVLRLGLFRAQALLRGNARNIHVHYDSGFELFEKFLDPEYLVYSCGYASAETDSLEQLQAAKLDRICKKLELRPGERMLDIGCGYGGLLIHAARQYGTTGVGITNSREMNANAQRQIDRYGLADRITVHYRDFGELPQTHEYDKVASVGMLEHVKRSDYDLYWHKVAGSLKPGGRALIHAIACATTVNEHDPFIQKYRLFRFLCG